MAEITFTIPNAVLNRVVNNASITWGYQETIRSDEGSIPNPQTKAQFVKAHMINYLMSAVKQAEADTAAATARATTESEITIS